MPRPRGRTNFKLDAKRKPLSLVIQETLKELIAKKDVSSAKREERKHKEREDVAKNFYEMHKRLEIEDINGCAATGTCRPTRLFGVNSSSRSPSPLTPPIFHILLEPTDLRNLTPHHIASSRFSNGWSHAAARRRVGEASCPWELGLGCSAAPFSPPASSSREQARARNLFVEMQQPQAKTGDDHDWLAGIPDDALLRVLFFMPAREVVQTSVLARSWRHRWKSMPALRIHVGHVREESEAQNMARFVDNLLRLRDSSEKLELCEFLIRDTMYIDIRLWIQKASMLKPRILIIDYKEELSLQIHIMPLIFGDLSTLELKSVDLRDELLDFSRCPALKNLLLRFCFIGLTKNISSQSLEHLTIMYCTFLSDAHIRISAPSLISLVLFENYGNTPFLDSMPSLVNASVKLHDCEYRCCQEEYGILCSDNGCRKCGANVDRSRDCVLLKGLSKAKSLELVAQRGVFLFERDLMCCPTFCNLKTLLLNDWSVASDLHPLLCFLQQTPVLEKLTLQLGQTPVNWVEPEGGYNTLEQSFPSKKLKVAEVFYEEFDTRVEAISRILKAHGMYLQHIQQTKRPSERDSASNLTRQSS
uniref:Uncharacterized protein n=1 Tax=Avena sativa TaxID=4498 RepID=A0ACD5WBP4_AVESA